MIARKVATKSTTLFWTESHRRKRLGATYIYILHNSLTTSLTSYTHHASCLLFFTFTTSSTDPIHVVIILHSENTLNLILYHRQVVKGRFGEMLVNNECM